MTGTRTVSRFTVFAVWMLLGAITATAQTPQFSERRGRATALGQLSDAFSSLAERVNVSVVKIVTVGYRRAGQDTTGVVSFEQPSGGSGVIVDSDGYVVTNAHVVVGAQRLRVVLSPRLDQSATRKSILKPALKSVPAEIVGLDFEADLALLKIDESGLPALDFGDSDTVAPGQIVFAFGSPLGLDNSVTMGVVSSPARQLEPESPMIYIQTDASINPGNSGGPLINTDGEIVGINTLIFSQSGGNEGLGFSVPSNIVSNVIRHIRERGRMIRGAIGVRAQTLDSTLAAGLKLSRASGVILSDVYPGGPADKAGLLPGDIVLSLDGKPMENARQLVVNLYRPGIGDVVRLEVLRGRETRTYPVKVVERPDDPGRFASLVSEPASKVDRFGIYGLNLTGPVKELLPPLRLGLGVLVAGRTADAPYLRQPFEVGDVIYEVNRERVTNLTDLNELISRMEPGTPVAVQVERGRQLHFLSFEMP